MNPDHIAAAILIVGSISFVLAAVLWVAVNGDRDE